MNTLKFLHDMPYQVTVPRSLTLGLTAPVLSCVVGIAPLSATTTTAMPHAARTKPSLAAAPAVSNWSTAEHHQFDFWIGKWDVTETVDHKPARSRLIEAVYAGSTLRENWKGPGYSGGSMNTCSDFDKH